MAKKIRNFAAILAVSAVVGTILLVLVFLLPVGPMRKNVEKSVGDMLKTGDEIPEDAFSQYLWKNRETYTDAIMVQNAIERLSDKNAYEHAMWMYHYDLDMFFLFLLRMFHTAQPSVAQIDPFFLFTDDHVQSVLIVSGL